MSEHGEAVDWSRAIELKKIFNPRLFGKPEARFTITLTCGRSATMRLTFGTMARLLGHENEESAEVWLDQCTEAERAGLECPSAPACDLPDAATQEITKGIKGMLAVTRLDCI